MFLLTLQLFLTSVRQKVQFLALLSVHTVANSVMWDETGLEKNLEKVLFFLKRSPLPCQMPKSVSVYFYKYLLQVHFKSDMLILNDLKFCSKNHEINSLKIFHTLKILIFNTMQIIIWVEKFFFSLIPHLLLQMDYKWKLII